MFNLNKPLAVCLDVFTRKSKHPCENIVCGRWNYRFIEKAKGDTIYSVYIMNIINYVCSWDIDCWIYPSKGSKAI